MKASKLLFQEVQKFTQWWLWLLLLGLPAFLLYDFLSPIFKENLSAHGNFSIGLIFSKTFLFSFVVLLLVLVLFLVMKLKTTVSQDSLSIQYFPFLSKTWKWDQVKEAYLINYGFVGYGIRLWTKYGTVYNVIGNKGLVITLKNGSRYLIGTQKPDELEILLTKVHKLS